MSRSPGYRHASALRRVREQLRQVDQDSPPPAIGRAAALADPEAAFSPIDCEPRGLLRPAAMREARRLRRVGIGVPEIALRLGLTVPAVRELLAGVE